MNINEVILSKILSRTVFTKFGCWLYLGFLVKGYGRVGLGDNRYRVHSWFYLTYVQEYPKCLEPDHLCPNKNCWNPEHLEPVTHRTNILRGKSMMAENARKLVCKRGHNEWSIINHGRRCLACHREDTRIRRASIF